MRIALSASILSVLALAPRSALAGGGQSTLLRSSPSSTDKILDERLLAVPVKETPEDDSERQRRRELVIANCPGVESFSFTITKRCKYASLRDKLNSIKSSSCGATGDEILLSLLGTTNQTHAEEVLVPQLCADAYLDTAETFPFSEITRKGRQFDNEYYSGGSSWNYEVQTDDGRNVLKDDAARVKRIFEDQAQGKVIDLPNYLPAFDPEGDGCELDAAFCCWVQDRQAGDNNGNCNTPYESQCIDQDPGDNTNFCYTDHARSSMATHTEGGFSVFGNVLNGQENIEGAVHCHGFAWGQGGDDISNAYKGNNLFFISMYDHLHQRGYVRNAPGSAMCACAENMAVVTRADCTEIAVTEKFRFNYDEPTLTLSGVLLEVQDVDFNSCNGSPDNNDLESYYRRLVEEKRQTEENFAKLREILVGKQAGNCNDAIVKFMQEKGILRPSAATAEAVPIGDAPAVAGSEPATADMPADSTTDESKPEMVEEIDIAYDKASEGGDGAAMPEVPTDLASLGEDDQDDSSQVVPPPTESPVAAAAEIPAPTAPFVDEEPLKDEGEQCQHGWDCMSGKCLGTGKCAGMQAGGKPWTNGGTPAGGGTCAQEGEPCQKNRDCCDGGCGGKSKVCGAVDTAKNAK